MKNPFVLAFPVLLLVLLTACAGNSATGEPGKALEVMKATEAAKSAGSDLRTVPYVGNWSGTIKTESALSQRSPNDFDFVLELKIGEKAFDVKQIRTDPNGSRTEISAKRGTFAVRRLATNMVASSITTGTSNGEPWVETWVLAMTLIDANSMLVHWTRVVNNPLVPKEKVDSKFSQIGMGIFVRSDPQQ